MKSTIYKACAVIVTALYAIEMLMRYVVGG